MFYVILGLILNAIANSSSHISVILVIGGISRIIAGIVTYPILAAISTVMYIKLRASKENVTADNLIGTGEMNFPPPATTPPPAPDRLSPSSGGRVR